MDSLKMQAVVMAAYDAGLRVSEICRLRVEDIDSQRMVIAVRNGKGGRDRMTMLPRRLLDLLRAYWKQQRPKGPELFPGREPETVVTRAAVNKALKQAARRAQIRKRVTPHCLRARQDPAVMYELLMRCAAQTLLALGSDPNRLGGELGVTTVLHTWSRDLSFHPHAHCIVRGGGLSQDAKRWLEARDNYLFPVEVLGPLFRGKLLDALRRAAKRGRLRINDPQAFTATVARLYEKNWVTYCERPFGGPEQVVRYLGQYTHRIAISNHRLVAMDERGVTFRTKNGKKVTVDGVTFLRR